MVRFSERDKLIQLLEKLRKSSEAAEGFVSTTTSSKLIDPGEFIVISEWKSADAWGEWMNDNDVGEIQRQMDSLVGEKTFFDIYKPESF